MHLQCLITKYILSLLRLTGLILTILLTGLTGHAQLTLDYCLDRARDNYPALKKINLIDLTESVELADINSAWLPRVGVYAQATAQSAVTAFPSALKAMLDHSGTTAAGMSRLQYKAGVEVNQTVWDGGRSGAGRSVARASAATSRAALEVEMYGLRDRVENLYFGILLIEEQIKRSESTLGLLRDNLSRLESMVRNGLATPGDANMVEAQILTMSQQITEARSSAAAMRRALALFIDEDVTGATLTMPQCREPRSFTSFRPELDLFESRLAENGEREKALDSSLRPGITFFAQAFYGYPGFNMFESMMKRDPSLNTLAGLRATWQIDPLYTLRNSRRRLHAASDMIRNDREIFLFNSAIASAQQQEDIDGLRRVIADDERIVSLRRDVRKAAESQLSHGIIDTTALLTKINDENQALLNQSFHEISLARAIMKLKYTLNN